MAFCIFLFGVGGTALSYRALFDTTLTDIESHLESLSVGAKYHNKYPLGHCIFYSDGREIITRVGDIDTVRIHWDRTKVAFNEQVVTIDLWCSAKGGGITAEAIYVRQTFSRQKDETHTFTILNNDLAFEIIEDRGTGIVCVLGVKKAANPDEVPTLLRLR